MPDTVVCQKCGTSNRADQRFCGNCGSSLTQVCSVCGTENPLNFQFCGNCGSNLREGATAAAAAPKEERRWATILFGDLSGFTKLSETMDPEDVRSMIDRGMTALGEIVERFGGNVSAVAGDEIMALFGAPTAHEDDPERAVRAALEMQRFAADHPDQFGGLEMRIGINTGEVMFAPVGTGASRDFTVIGDVVNTASRLESAAKKSGVLVGEETFRASRGSVDYREVEPITAKGKQRPVAAWEPTAVAEVPLGRPLGTAPLLGRQSEIQFLEHIWERVLHDRRAHLVTVLGEPGVGKSRLSAEFLRRIRGDTEILEGRCLAYGDALGYWALAMVIKQAAGITGADDTEEARSKLHTLVRTVLGSGPSTDQVAQHIALLSGLDVEADRAEPAGDQKILHGSVRRLMEGMARKHPVCLVIEDIHWATDAFLDLIESLVSRTSLAPLMVLTQSRPELLERRPDWGGGLHAYTSLLLEPLDDATTGELVAELLRGHQLDESVAGAVQQIAEGNPLFAEELVAMVAERGIKSGIPSTIKALITARLDMLPSTEHRVVQLGGIFGTVLWEGAVRALGANGRLPDTLSELEAKDLLRSSEPPQFTGEREFVFKHGLIRDVAYESLPRVERRELHGRAAAWLESAAGDRSEEYLDQLAHHALEAGDSERALDYLSRAAERAHRAAAYRQEAALLTQGIDIADGPLERQLIVRRGIAYSRVGAWAESREDFERALQATPDDDIQSRIDLHIDLARVDFWLLRTNEVREHAEEAMRLVESVDRHDLEPTIDALVSQADSADGNIDSSIRYARGAVARAKDLGITPPFHIMPNLSLQYYWIGDFDEAIATGRETLRIAQERNDSSAAMWALPQLGLSLSGSGDFKQSIEVFDEARRFGTEYEVWTLLARSIAMSAAPYMDLFQFAKAEEMQEEARELGRSLAFQPPAVSAGVDLLLNLVRRGDVGRAEKLEQEVGEEVIKGAGWHGWLWKLRFAEAQAELALARGHHDEALEFANAAVEQSSANIRRKYESLGLASRARALAAGGQVKDAIPDLQRALEIARKMRDPALTLRIGLIHLEIEGDEGVAAETRDQAIRIAGGLSQELKADFENLEPVRQLLLTGRT